MFLDAVGGRALQTALDLGLIEAMKSSPRELEELCAVAQACERGLKPLLYLLTSMKLLNQEGECFALAQDTPRYLREEWPADRAELPPAPEWDELERAVRTGRCVRPPIEGQEDAGSFFSGVVETLFQIHWPAAQHLEAYLPECQKVLDLGAGSGAWSLGLVSRRSGVTAVAVDHARVLEEITTRFATEHGVFDRYEFRAGSYHEVELEEEAYQVVYLGHVVHSEGWEPSRSLLKRCYHATAPGGVLVIAEMVGSEPRGLDYTSNLFDLNMLMFTEYGCVFTRAELEQLAAEAGFGDPEWVEGPGQYPVLLATRA